MFGGMNLRGRTVTSTCEHAGSWEVSHISKPVLCLQSYSDQTNRYLQKWDSTRGEKSLIDFSVDDIGGKFMHGVKGTLMLS